MTTRRASHKKWAVVGVVLGVTFTLYHLLSISPVADWRIWFFELTANPAVLAIIGLVGAGLYNSIFGNRKKEVLHDISEGQLKKVTEAQYSLLGSRRIAYDNSVWQTPVISLLAQTFLFAIAFGGGTLFGRLLASLLAIACSFASFQLFERHRHNELYHAQLLDSIELAQPKKFANICRKPKNFRGLAGCKSHQIWQVLLVSFGAAALLNLYFLAFQYFEPDATLIKILSTMPS